MRRLPYLLPLLLFLGLAGFLWHGLSQDPDIVPSALIDRPAPPFALDAVAGSGRPGLVRADLIGRVTLLSVFASWCLPCLAEHPLLMGLAEDRRLRLVGIAYKDAPAATTGWLARQGDPYSAIGADTDGRVAIDFGVYGVPESYLIDPKGIIRYKQVGPLTAEVIERDILPLAAKLAP